MQKLYEQTNCAFKKFEVNGREIKFTPWGTQAGALCGTFVAETEEDIKAIDALAKDPKNGIVEITPDQYELKTKIKIARQGVNFVSSDGNLGPKKTTVRAKPNKIASAPITTDTSNVERVPKNEPPPEEKPAIVEASPILQAELLQPVQVAAPQGKKK